MESMTRRGGGFLFLVTPSFLTPPASVWEALGQIPPPSEELDGMFSVAPSNSMVLGIHPVAVVPQGPRQKGSPAFPEDAEDRIGKLLRRKCLASFWVTAFSLTRKASWWRHTLTYMLSLSKVPHLQFFSIICFYIFPLPPFSPSNYNILT